MSDLTIGKKMFMIGVVIVTGLSFLAGNAFRTNAVIEKASANAVLRDSQYATLNQILQTHSRMMLAAMDSIINKDEGKISPERMTVINSGAEFFQSHSITLQKLADTDEEAGLVKNIMDNGYFSSAGEKHSDGSARINPKRSSQGKTDSGGIYPDR